MKTLERAILLPSEMQSDIKDKQYPEIGKFLMDNPFPKKKKKKGGKGKGKKKRRWTPHHPLITYTNDY